MSPEIPQPSQSGRPAQAPSSPDPRSPDRRSPKSGAPKPTAFDPRFPIGRFQRPEPGATIPPGDRDHAIATIAELPEQLRNALDGLDERQLGTPYRDGGWSVRQLVHHIADSHMNAFIRIRLALTEDWPLVPNYNQDAWAELADSSAPVEWSLELIESLHARWGMLLRSLSDEQFQRGFKHAEHGPMTIEFATLLYAWHGSHHLAHITRLRVAQAW